MALTLAIRDYAIGFANATAEELSRVGATWTANGKTLRESAGILVPTGYKEFNEEPDPIPGRAEVSWRTPDGRDHQQQVEVASRIPNLAAFSGTIFFKITDGGVQLVPLTNAERDRLADEHKPYP